MSNIPKLSFPEKAQVSSVLDFIRAHGSIEKVIGAETRSKPKLPREDYLKQVNLTRSVFQTLPTVPEDAMLWFRDVDGEKRTSMNRQSDVLFVMGKYGLSREVEWDTDDALKGGYFDDDPSTTIEGNTNINYFPALASGLQNLKLLSLDESAFKGFPTNFMSSSNGAISSPYPLDSQQTASNGMHKKYCVHVKSGVDLLTPLL
ncbi:hypothetical protein BDP27DRAFT_1412704 [Rhodocollybia butyracea]|uniref:Uncharacterized protein n=1 Tax=Rhodocollybia butyracea TaxID=206335 RepID=A0A9P5QBA1_9AGAR|nr:hypothetical protein BDP27DRAFT_1412704 [Rhodocollybia butyracea]